MEVGCMALMSFRFRRNEALLAAARNAPPLRMGATGVGVRALQQALLDLGQVMPISTRLGGRPDGVFGSETAGAVKGFQRVQGLTADGVAGQQTLGKLDGIFVRNDPFYLDPIRARAALLAQANGPYEHCAFAWQTSPTKQVG